MKTKMHISKKIIEKRVNGVAGTVEKGVRKAVRTMRDSL